MGVSSVALRETSNRLVTTTRVNQINTDYLYTNLLNGRFRLYKGKLFSVDLCHCWIVLLYDDFAISKAAY